MIESFSNVLTFYNKELFDEAGNTQKAHPFFANRLAVYADTDKQEAAYKFVRFISASEQVAELSVDNSRELPAVTNEEVLQPYVRNYDPLRGVFIEFHKARSMEGK